MATKNTRLVLYISPELKAQLEVMASAARPPTSTNKMAVYLIGLGKQAHEQGWVPEPVEADNEQDH